jgi:RIO-like serine/threonine protein kinase
VLESITSSVEQLSRDHLADCTVRQLYPARNWTKADVTLVKVNGRVLAVKDIKPRHLLVRRLFGRWLLQREFCVLSRLRGMAGVPHVYKMLDADAFVMDFIEGVNLGTLREVSDATMQRLSRLFDELHRHGVAHGDPHASNILVTENGEPFLIDFSTAAMISENSKGWHRWLWKEFRKQDVRRLAKMKERFAPHLLTQEEKQLLADPSRLYRLSKALRHSWEWVTFKPMRNRWKEGIWSASDRKYKS